MEVATPKSSEKGILGRQELRSAMRSDRRALSKPSLSWKATKMGPQPDVATCEWRASRS